MFTTVILIALGFLLAKAVLSVVSFFIRANREQQIMHALEAEQRHVDRLRARAKLG